MPHDALVVLKNDFKRSCLQPSLLFKGSTPDPQPSKSTPVCRLQKRTRSILQSAGAFFSRKASQISAPPSPRLGPTLPHSKPRPFSDFFHIEIKTEAEKRRQSQLDVSLISPLKSLANSSQCSQSDVPTVFSLEESTVSISRSNSIENHVSAMRRITIVDPMAVGTGGAENRRVTIADPLSMEENKRISTVDSLTLDSKRTTPSASPVLNPMKLVNSFDSLVGLSRTSSEITLTDPCAFTPHLPRSVFSKSGDVAKKERRGIQVWQDTCSQLVKDSVPMPDRGLLPRDQAISTFILHELYTTEQSYFRLLSLVEEKFMLPMIQAAQEKQPFVKQSDIPLLFKHLPDMLVVSFKLLEALKEEDTPWHDLDLEAVTCVFLQLEEELSVYVRYAVHHRTYSKAIRRSASNTLVSKTEQTLALKESHRMSISDFLIAPFQRIPRYCLLLKDLIRHTSTSHPLYAQLNRVLYMLTGLAVAMDHVQKIPKKA